ncbi:MAG: helix-turn-helix transcriptional regulator [Xanthobacteraceae bacterium]|nr:helix-turn-helix transcriptional regulator [Xanthobacteraceae bacterium]
MGRRVTAKEALARNLRRFRQERDLSQEELAARARLTQHLISALELRKANPELNSLERVARALGVSVAELFF